MRPKAERKFISVIKPVILRGQRPNWITRLCKASKSRADRGEIFTDDWNNDRRGPGVSGETIKLSHHWLLVNCKGCSNIVWFRLENLPQDGVSFVFCKENLYFRTFSPWWENQQVGFSACSLFVENPTLDGIFGGSPFSSENSDAEIYSKGFTRRSTAWFLPRHVGAPVLLHSALLGAKTLKKSYLAAAFEI